MRRSALAAALLILTPGLRAAQGWEEPPPLTPPALEPPAQSPSAEASSNRPLLVIPGITAPAAPKPAPAVAPSPSPSPSPAPPLVGPKPMDDNPRVTLSLPLEPIPPDDETAPKVAKPAAEPRQKPPAAAERAPATHRPLGVFGRLLGTEGASSASGNGISIEAHSDPAVEAAVKRRVEKQIVESLGKNVRDVEVRVKGRDILIQARASHFWLYRSARRTLDALPLPAGYRARVEMK